MGFEIGGGIVFGPGITIQLPPNTPPGPGTFIDTENLEPLLTEGGDNLITES